MTHSEMVLRLMGIVRSCPGEKRLPSCPCYQLSKKNDLKYCYFFFAGMPMEDLTEFHSKHISCLRERNIAVA